MLQLLALGLLSVYRRCQALARQLRQLHAFSAKRLIQVKELQGGGGEFTEDGRENGEREGRQWDLELRLDYLEWLVLDVQLLVGANHIPQMVVVQGVQVQVEDLLEVGRRVTVYRFDEADLGLLGQVDGVGGHLVVVDVDVVELHVLGGHFIGGQGDQVVENGQVRLLRYVPVLEHVGRPTSNDPAPSGGVGVETAQRPVVGIYYGPCGQEGDRGQNNIQGGAKGIDKGGFQQRVYLILLTVGLSRRVL